MMSTRVILWPSISLLHNLVKTLTYLQAQSQEPLPPITYRSKIKLHGTNSAIQCRAEGVFAQSRTLMLSEQSDNKGFARWLSEHKAIFASLPVGMTIFGEWCGPGVEGGMATSQLKRKIFAIFAIQSDQGEDASLEVDPARLREIVPYHPDVFVLPWQGSAFVFDLGGDLNQMIAQLNSMIEEIEREDPWVKETFGVSGIGEGLVLYPLLETLTPALFERYAFKAKGEKHRTVATKKAVQATAEKVESAVAFAQLTVTQARLEQGLSEACGGEASLQKMGPFIQWINQDVQKECQAELTESHLSWQETAKHVTHHARDWFKSQCEKAN